MANEKDRLMIRAATFAIAGGKVGAMARSQRTKSGKAALLMAERKLMDEAYAARKEADAMDPVISGFPQRRDRCLNVIGRSKQSDGSLLRRSRLRERSR